MVLHTSHVITVITVMWPRNVGAITKVFNVRDNILLPVVYWQVNSFGSRLYEMITDFLIYPTVKVAQNVLG